MLIKKRKTKLMRILAIAFIIFGMAGMTIPQGIFATNISIARDDIEFNTILYPGDELTGFVGGSKSFIAYRMMDSNDPSSDYYCGDSYVEGNAAGVDFADQNKPAHMVMSYEEVVAAMAEERGLTVPPLPTGTVFVSWVVGYSGIGSSLGVARQETYLTPLTVSYSDSSFVPKIEYEEINGERKLYAVPQDLGDVVFHGNCRQEITKEKIAEQNIAMGYKYKPCHVMLDGTFEYYTNDDMAAAINIIKDKLILGDIADTEKGEKAILEGKAVQAEGYDNLRYIPELWNVDELGLSGTFVDSNARSSASFVAEIPTDRIGEFIADITWQGQVLQDGVWVSIDDSVENAKLSSRAEYKVYESVIPEVPDDTTKPGDTTLPDKTPTPDETQKPDLAPNETPKPDLAPNETPKPDIKPEILADKTPAPETSNQNKPVVATEDMTMISGSMILLGISFLSIMYFKSHRKSHF